MEILEKMGKTGIIERLEKMGKTEIMEMVKKMGSNVTHVANGCSEPIQVRVDCVKETQLSQGKCFIFFFFNHIRIGSIHFIFNFLFQIH